MHTPHRRSAASGDNEKGAGLGILGCSRLGTLPALCLFGNSAAAAKDVVLYFGIFDILQVSLP